jgi:acetoin utilization deacetylase AcuC-like enzyme
MKVFWDERQRAHAPAFFMLRGTRMTNFEVEARADALLALCREAGLAIHAPSDPSPLDAVREVHADDYLAFLRDGHAAWAAIPGAAPEIVPNCHPAPEMIEDGARVPPHIMGQAGWYTYDTSVPIGPKTWEAALASAACAVAAADEAAAGRSAYALCRPPGHHAYPRRAAAHCLINNAAVAAERLRAAGAARVGVLDIDCHHGNGTQHIFWRRDDVRTVSVHGDPASCYPWYVGHASERGAGPGAGCNLNLPLPRGTGDEVWMRAVRAGLRALQGCDALVVSLGLDAHRDEPLGYLGVGDDGYARAGEAIRAHGLPCAIVQEGGYNTESIGRLLGRFMQGLQG